MKLVSSMEDVEKAHARVAAEIDAVDATDLSTMNVDIVSAASLVLGVSERILSFRERIAKLPEYDMSNVDKLVDYAKATWFIYLTSQPPLPPAELDALLREAADLRAKLLMWAAPLVGAGHFDEAAIARIRDGGGHKDLASDLVALVGVYRSKWTQVQNICAVTDADLDRAALIGPTVFALISQREQSLDHPGAEGSLRLRRALTKLDRAYFQCRRAIRYFRESEADVDEIAPNLRRNPGNQRAAAKPAESAQTSTSSASSTTNASSAASPNAPVAGFGSGGSPFVTGDKK